MRAIGAQIREARLATALSQEEAAERSGVGYKRWQEIERGLANPTVRTLDRIAATLDVDLRDLVPKSGHRRRK